MDWPRRLGVAFAVTALSALTPTGAAPTTDAMHGIPRLVLWAWERPEDLRALGDDVGVAFLAQTIRVARDRVTLRPRLQPLRVGAATPLVAVTRIETARATVSSTGAVAEIATLIVRSAALPRVRGVQIDFDAVVSERDFYRQIIRDLRDRIGPSTPLSITALASWCVGDDWLGGLPIDEAVPMLFRMGPEHEPFARMAAQPSTAAAACRGAIGTSLDEPLAVSARHRRLYVFNNSAWTPGAVRQARSQLQ
jgi:uncharacterized protein DUF3142